MSTIANHETVLILSMNSNNMKPVEPHKNALAFSKAGEVSMFKNETYKISAGIRLNSSRMFSIVCVFYSFAGLNVDVL